MNILKNYRYTLEGLDCANCEKKIEDKIAQTEGYNDVTVQFEDGTVASHLYATARMPFCCFLFPSYPLFLIFSAKVQQILQITNISLEKLADSYILYY